MLTIAEIRGMLPASLIEFHLIWSPGELRFFLAGLIDSVQRRLRTDDTRGVRGCPLC